MHLTRKDTAFIVLLTGGWACVSLAALEVAPAWGSIVATGLAMAIVLVIVFEVYRRLVGALRQCHAEPSVNYRQIESLFSLFASLPIDHPLPPMRVAAVSPDFANTLIGLVRETRPRLVVELGSGLSTLLVAYCLKQHGAGRIVSLEQDVDYAAATRAGLAERGLQDFARVIDAPLREVTLNGRSWAWYDTSQITALGPIDLLVVDGPLQEGQNRRMLRYPALPLLNARLGPRAVVLLDDADREDERHVVELWMKEFPQFERRHVPSEKGTIILRKRA
jgi:predicted O-methyltransferase YrrM